MQYFANFAETHRTLRWLMGDLDVSAYQPLVTALPLLVFCLQSLPGWRVRSTCSSLGTDSAETHGVNITLAQRLAFFSASSQTGAAVSVGGPIGFVGIVVPHS